MDRILDELCLETKARPLARTRRVGGRISKKALPVRGTGINSELLSGTGARFECLKTFITAAHIPRLFVMLIGFRFRHFLTNYRTENGKVTQRSL